MQPNILEEVCEGETFLLECPVGTLIHLDPAVLTEFGRNGAWEVESGGSRCGSENVSDCSVVPVPLATFLQPRPCHGKQTCEVALSRALGHLCLGRRKYLTINFTCNAEKVEGEILEVSGLHSEHTNEDQLKKGTKESELYMGEQMDEQGDFEKRQNKEQEVEGETRAWEGSGNSGQGWIFQDERRFQGKDAQSHQEPQGEGEHQGGKGNQESSGGQEPRDYQGYKGRKRQQRRGRQEGGDREADRYRNRGRDGRDERGGETVKFGKQGEVGEHRGVGKPGRDGEQGRTDPRDGTNIVFPISWQSWESWSSWSSGPDGSQYESGSTQSSWSQWSEKNTTGSLDPGSPGQSGSPSSPGTHGFPGQPVTYSDLSVSVCYS